MKARSKTLAFLLVAAAMAWGCRATHGEDSDLRAVHVADIRLDPKTESPVVELTENAENGRSLSIWVGEFEAESIARAMDNQPSPRPNPHDLLKAVVDRMHGHVLRTLVTELREGTYFAVIELELRGRTVSLDARPSDAIAIALRAGAPLFVKDSLFTPANEIPDDENAVDIDDRAPAPHDCPVTATL